MTDEEKKCESLKMAAAIHEAGHAIVLILFGKIDELIFITLDDHPDNNSFSAFIRRIDTRRKLDYSNLNQIKRESIFNLAGYICQYKYENIIFDIYELEDEISMTYPSTLEHDLELVLGDISKYYEIRKKKYSVENKKWKLVNELIEETNRIFTDENGNDTYIWEITKKIAEKLCLVNTLDKLQIIEVIIEDLKSIAYKENGKTEFLSKFSQIFSSVRSQFKKDGALKIVTPIDLRKTF